MPSPEMEIRLMQRADSLLEQGDRVYMEAVLPAVAARARPGRSISGPIAMAGAQHHLIGAIVDLLLSARKEGDDADELGYALLIAGVVRLYGQACMVAAPS